MKLIFSHPTGNANVRAAAVGFQKANLLSRFYTTLATFENDFFDQLSRIGPLSELKRRSYDLSLQSRTEMWPWKEVGRLISMKTGLNSFIKKESGIFSVDAVYRNLDARVSNSLSKASKKGVSAVYAYEDGAALSFARAKELGLQCYYDLPIGYWKTAQRLLKIEQEKWPEWANTLTALSDSQAKLQRKDLELTMADRIFVASQFTASTLKDFGKPLPQIEVIPYGYPKVENNRIYRSLAGNKKLKLLFVGLLDQRKGIANLFAAVEPLKNYIDLTIVGLKTTENCIPLNNALKSHNWISNLPHANILKLMKEHDALVFPSLFEGFGLVITEAMSQGTPVITTERTAGPDLITNNENGWLVEAGSTDALAGVFESLLAKPEQLAEAGKAASYSASLRPWEVYGKELATALANNTAN